MKESDMKKQDYRKTILTDVTSEEAFGNIVSVRNWWTSSFKGSAEKLNDEFDVRFGKTTVNFKVTESVPFRKLVWLVTDCNLDWLNDKKEWKDTKIVWNLIKEKNKTKIEMTHVGLVPGIECYEDCEDGWNRYIGDSLPKLLSSGKGSIF
jgi:hypothetical protein